MTPTVRGVTTYLAGAITGLAIGTVVLTIAIASTTIHVEKTSPSDIAAQFGVTVHYFKDARCGGAADAAGCTLPGSTDTIYIQSGLPADVTRSATLHELGHIMQNRLGLPNDECKADQFARSLGATALAYC